MLDREDTKIVSIVYTNYQGETRVRKIAPQRIWFGKTAWHPGEQWLLDAYDVEKKADRTFAMKDIKAWFAEDGSRPNVST